MTSRFSKPATDFLRLSQNVVEAETTPNDETHGNCHIVLTPSKNTGGGCYEWVEDSLQQIRITDWSFDAFVVGEINDDTGIPQAELDEINAFIPIFSLERLLIPGVPGNGCSISAEDIIQTDHIRVRILYSFLRGKFEMSIYQGRLITTPPFSMTFTARYTVKNTFVTNPALQFNALTLSQWVATSDFQMPRTLAWPYLTPTAEYNAVKEPIP